MATLKNSYRVNLKFTPWTDSGYRVTRLQMIEQLNGEIPHGEIDLFLDDTNTGLVTDQNTGTIDIINEKEDNMEVSYEGINVYITEREYFGNSLNIKFIVTDDIKFYTERKTKYHSKSIPLHQKIQDTFPGNDDGISPTGRIRIMYDVPDITLWQNDETDYEFNRRLCYSYKKDSIFAYGWRGLLIKDRMGEYDHLGNKEPDEELKLEANRKTFHSDTYNLTYKKRVNYEPFDPYTEIDPKFKSTVQTDLSEYESKHHRVQMNYQEYHVIRKDHEPYLKNSWYNGRIMENMGYTHFEVDLTEIPKFELGDVIIYNRRAEQDDEHDKIPWKYYLVTSNEIFYTIDATKKTNHKNFKFGWTSMLYGVEPGKWSEEP